MEMNFKSLFNFSANIADVLPDAVLVINSKHHISYLNNKAAEFFGYEKTDMMGKNISVLFHEESQKLFFPADKNIVIKFYNQGGLEEYAEIAKTDLLNGDTVLVLRNVTHLQTTVRSLLAEYDKAKKISQNKNGFLANLSNELRNPMHSIIGFSQALLDGLGGKLNEKQEKYISIISRNASSLFELLNSILDISKIEAGVLEINYKTFDMAQVINLVTGSFTPSIEDKKLKFVVDTSALLKRNCYSDENIIRQVLMNLLNNAVKFTDRGQISLEVKHPEIEYLTKQGVILKPESTDKSYLMFSVSDTGIGISDQELNVIFEEYRSVDRLNLKKNQGSGLGLAITRRLLEEIGGVIWVESKVNEGSVFRFVIPIDRPAVQDVQSEVKSDPAKETVKEISYEK